VVSESKCNPESGGGYREFHFNDSLPGAFANARRTELPDERSSGASAEQALNRIE
jgi:hypothetical protein